MIRRKENVRGWSTEELRNTSSSVLVEGTEEMIGWRAMSQIEVDECRTKIAGKIEEEVLSNHKVEDSTKEAYRGRSVPMEWILVRRNMQYRIRKWGEECWARIFSWFREYNLQRAHCMKEDSTEEEEMKQQQRMNVIQDMTRRIRAKDKWMRTAVGGLVSWLPTAKKRGSGWAT